MTDEENTRNIQVGLGFGLGFGAIFTLCKLIEIIVAQVLPHAIA